MKELDSILLLDFAARRALLEKWNQAYRSGGALVSDAVYDTVLDSLPDGDDLRRKVGFDIGDERKCKLPLPMFSMDKCKSAEELAKWLSLKDVDPATTTVVISPKFDGLSFLVHHDTRAAYTRGNGHEGQRSDHHFAALARYKSFGSVAALQGQHLIGEVIMPKKIFSKKYAADFRNPRNLVAGLFNQKNLDPALQDVDFIAYGIGREFQDKAATFAMLNQFNTVPLPHEIMPAAELRDDILNACFENWGRDYELDGLIVEIAALELRQELGREKNDNPAYGRAWKGFREHSAETSIRNIHYQVSKDGRLSAVGQVDPIGLDGVTVSNVTLYNAGTIEKQQWGVGARVRVVRSGMVIPKIIATLVPVAPALPASCPSCGKAVAWDDNHVHLVCRNHGHCTAQRIQKIIAYLDILGVDEIGEGVVEQLYHAGYDTIDKLLQVKAEDLLQLERFAERKAQIVCANIRAKMSDIPLEKLQHATGLFKGLGTKRLALVRHFDHPGKKPTLEQLLQVDGFSNISAQAYLDGFDKFWEFIKPLPLTIAKGKPPVSSRCQDMRVCFTGYRDTAMEERIAAEGGKVVGAVNKKTTHLIARDVTTSSSKLDKAVELGITVWSPEDLSAFMERSS